MDSNNVSMVVVGADTAAVLIRPRRFGWALAPGRLRGFLVTLRPTLFCTSLCSLKGGGFLTDFLVNLVDDI